MQSVSFPLTHSRAQVEIFACNSPLQHFSSRNLQNLTLLSKVRSDSEKLQARNPPTENATSSRFSDPLLKGHESRKKKKPGWHALLSPSNLKGYPEFIWSLAKGRVKAKITKKGSQFSLIVSHSAQDVTRYHTGTEERRERWERKVVEQKMAW